MTKYLHCIIILLMAALAVIIYFDRYHKVFASCMGAVYHIKSFSPEIGITDDTRRIDSRPTITEE